MALRSRKTRAHMRPGGGGLKPRHPRRGAVYPKKEISLRVTQVPA